jgi:hypothetical protein
MKDVIILLILVVASIVGLLNEVDKHFDRNEFYSEVRGFMERGNRYTPEMERESIIAQCELCNANRVILGNDPIDCQKFADSIVKREWRHE